MRKKQKEPEIGLEEPVLGFKIKVTNLRKTAYPDVPKSTDLLDIKPGDFVTKGTKMSSIYEVISIKREPISDSNYTYWNNKVTMPNSEIRDKKFKKLIDEYKKNGNFGACYIILRPILRGSKSVNKGKIFKISELHQAPCITTNGYFKIDLHKLYQIRFNNCLTIQLKISKLQDKFTVADNIKEALWKIINKNKVQEVRIEVEEQQDPFIREMARLIS